MSQYFSFLWSSLLFFAVAIPLLLVAMGLLVLALSPFFAPLRILRQLPFLLKPADPRRLEKYRQLMEAIGRWQGYDVEALDRIWDDRFGTTRDYLGVIERRWFQGTPLTCEAYMTRAGAGTHIVLWIAACRGPINTSGDYIVLDRRVQEQLLPILGPSEDEFLRRVVEWKPSLQSLIPLQAQVNGRRFGGRVSSGDGRLFSFKVVKDFGLLEEMRWSLPKLKGGPETTWMQVKADVGIKDNEILVVLDYSESTGGPVHQGTLRGPIKAQYSVQSTTAEPKRSQYPLGKAGREALRRILATAHDSASAA